MLEHFFQVGRYVVATRDLEPLDLILEDFPAVFGPNHDSPPGNSIGISNVNIQQKLKDDRLNFSLLRMSPSCGWIFSVSRM